MSIGRIGIAVLLTLSATACGPKHPEMGLPDVYYEMAEPHTPLDGRVARLIPSCDPPSRRMEADCAAVAEILRSDPERATERFVADWRAAVASVRRSVPAEPSSSPALDLRGISADDAAWLVPVAVVALALGATASEPAATVRAGRVEAVRRVQRVAIREVYASRPDDEYCRAMAAHLASLESRQLDLESVDAFEDAHRAEAREARGE